MFQNLIKTWKTRKNRKDTGVTLQKQHIFRKIMYWSPRKLFEIADFQQKSWNLHTTNPKHTRRTHQNRLNFWVRSMQNHRNSFKSWKIIEKASTKLQSTISNTPKPDQKLKNNGKSKRYISNAPKAAYFSKNPVLEPTKIARNRRFPVKIVKFAYYKFQTH